MSFNYPVSLNITGKKCLVIGGGTVAFRKVNSLLEAGAEVLVISREILPEMQELLIEKKIHWIAREINYNLFKNIFLVITATDCRELNSQVASYCQENSILVNVVDNLAESSFIVNAYFKQGDLAIAVSTNGKSPALARKIKNELTQSFGTEYASLLEIMAEIREIAKEQLPDIKIRNQFLRDIVNSDILEIIQKWGIEVARERVKTCLLSYLD